MADLGTITFGNYSATNSTVDGVVGTQPVLDNITTPVDGSYVHTDNNNSNTEYAWFPLGNMPSDFESMDTLSINVRYLRDVNGPDKAWDSLQAQIFTADGGTTSLVALLTVASSITTRTATNSGATAFTSVTASDKTTWDGAWLRLTWNKTKNKGGENDSFRVTAAELTGTYTQTVTATDVDPVESSVAVASATATVTGQTDVAPVESSVAVASAVTDVEGQTDVAAVESSVAVASATADVTSPVPVDPVESSVAVTSATATVTGQTDVNPTESSVAVASAVTDVEGQTDVAPVESSVAVASAVADVGGAVVVDPVASSVAVDAAIVDLISVGTFDAPGSLVATPGLEQVVLTWNHPVGVQ